MGEQPGAQGARDAFRDGAPRVAVARAMGLVWRRRAALSPSEGVRSGRGHARLLEGVRRWHATSEPGVLRLVCPSPCRFPPRLCPRVASICPPKRPPYALPLSLSGPYHSCVDAGGGVGGGARRHDVFAEVQGPSVQDVAHNFAQRWNQARRDPMCPDWPPPPPHEERPLLAASGWATSFPSDESETEWDRETHTESEPDDDDRTAASVAAGAGVPPLLSSMQCVVADSPGLGSAERVA